MQSDLRRQLIMATNDPYLGPGILEKKLANAQPILHLGRTVGVVIPKLEGDRWRTGPIFIEPNYRGKGLAKRFIKEFFEGKKGRAWIAPANKASIGAYVACGFYQSGRTITEGGLEYHEYLLG